MSTKSDPAFLRSFDRQMLRSAFQSLFWSIFSDRKRKGKMTQQQFADALGVDKSAVSRSFSIPQNWTIDKLADMAGVLGVELVVEARDAAASGVVFTANGVREVVTRAGADGNGRLPMSSGAMMRTGTTFTSNRQTILSAAA
jgi:predicted XRE-type DNA-binding protein